MKKDFFYYFGLFMVIGYLAFGIYVIIRGDKYDFFATRPATFRYVFGCLLIGYGVYRFGKMQFQRRINGNDYNDQILDNDEER